MTRLQFDSDREALEWAREQLYRLGTGLDELWDCAEAGDDLRDDVNGYGEKAAEAALALREYLGANRAA